MDMIHASTLTPTQAEDAGELARLCREHDRISLTFPTGEGDYYLLYEKSTLVSALSAFYTGNDTTECCAFTHPAARRQGCFTRLLEALTEELGEQDIIFMADERCCDTVCTLQALGAEVWYREYMMEFDFDGCSGRDAGALDSSGKITFQPARHTTSPSPTDKQCDANCTNITGSQCDTNCQDIADGPGLTGEEYSILYDCTKAGSFFLDFRGNEVYFYEFEIDPQLRGKGIGTAAFRHLLDILSRWEEHTESFQQLHFPANRPMRLLLQVSGGNEAACSLYQNAGLSITDALTCYLY